MTIKEQLLEMGMQEHEIDNWQSTLYVLKNEISDKFVEQYEFKNQVTNFIDNIDRVLWYEIPFGYANEDYNERYGKK